MIPDFGLFFIVLVHDDDVVAVQAFDGRDEGAGPGGDDQGLRFFFSCVSRRYFCIQADFDTGLAGQPFIGLSQFVHFPFEGDGLFALQDAADFAFFFTEDDLMAAAGCRIGCIQAARAGAGDKDFLFDRCRLDFRPVQFPADEGIDGAAARGSRRPFSHTGETAQAVDDVGVPAFHDFLRRFGIGQQLPGHVDDVGFPRSDDAFHHGRVGQAADSRYGLADVLLDFRS